MQQIYVRRYQNPGDYEGWVEPEDRSWVLFLDKKGIPSLYRQTEGLDEEGKKVIGYINVETLEDPS